MQRRKDELLRIIVGDVCPVCEGHKFKYQWTCGPCYQPNFDTPEQRALSDTCDAHMDAAEVFLTLAQRSRLKVSA